MTTTRPRAVTRFVLVAVALPVLASAVAVVLQLAAGDALPDPIAIHWGANGAPDGFGPAGTTVLATAALGLGLPLLIAASALNGLRRGDRGPVYRLMGALAAAMSVFTAVLMTASMRMQSGVTDAATGPSVLPWLAAAAVAALVAGVAAWALQPDERVAVVGTSPTMSPPLSVDERAVWLRSVRLARGGLIVLGAALALLIAVAVVSIAVSDGPVTTTVLIALVVLMAAVIAATAVFHVRVDETGLTVISATGFPRVHIPITEVERVEVVDVSPMGEFGGWGLRWAPGGGFGVVLRAGPGIRVARADRRVFTVTVDDAQTGAALLAAEVARAAGR